MQQGSIVLVYFPFSDTQSSKRRPAVIVSNNQLNQSESFILAAITSNLINDQYSFTIEHRHTRSPMLKDSEVRCHKLFTAERGLIIKEINQFQNGPFNQLLIKIKSYF